MNTLLSPEPVAGIVLDLFGTLVDAPTPSDRTAFCARLADLLGVSVSLAEHLVRHSWLARHDGTLPTTIDLATYLASLLTGSDTEAPAVAALLEREAERRLTPDHSVVAALEVLRSRGLRLGVLSDASADIAAAWNASKLAPLVDAAVFSATAGAVKPAPALYLRLLAALDVPAADVLYCGDGGGDELNGAAALGMRAVAVPTRGAGERLTTGRRPWVGAQICGIEALPELVAATGKHR